MKKRFASLLVALALLAGCSQEAPNAEPVNLRIGVPDLYAFDRQYRDYFDAAFPDWETTAIEWPDDADAFTAERWGEWLETEKPDLLLANVFDYRKLSDAGELRDLEEFASRGEMDLGRFNPAVLDYLKTNGDGKLFGLSPFFSTSALYYNKDMFDRLGIPYPQDGMTWPETLSLANRFMRDDRLGEDEFGLHVRWVRSPFDLIRQISYTEGLEYANLQTGAVTIDTESWRNVFEAVIAAYLDGTFRTQNVQGEEADGTVYYGPEALAEMDLFSQGAAAMTVDGDDLMQRLKSAAPGFRWGAVTAPVRVSDPSRAGWFNTGSVFAIPVVSSQPNEAWEAIDYFHSERMGRAAVALGEGLLSLKDDPVWRGDADYEVFYRTLPVNALPETFEPVVSPEFAEPFDLLVERGIGSVLAGKATVEEALAAIQKEGEALVMEFRQEEAAPDA
ncbi:MULTISPECIES: ABC transporter substrate-binding protein [Cohnella]|uniref:ABC transporter substrate-binding protein n=1 Tax=Cohnella TaxID=329857 RepID=UPI0009B998AA|nr:extracellular solute-binding protein [Cohnella massiliensis]MBN2980769.1 extracellular solute-binding protein [Cohnella algarum]